MLQVLLAILNDIKEDLALVKRELSHLNESVSNIEEQMNQTTSKLAISLQSATNATSQQLTHLCDKTNTLDSKLTLVNALISEKVNFMP